MLKAKKLALLAFNFNNPEGELWTCSVCNPVIRQSLSGYTNLCTHVHNHEKDITVQRAKSTAAASTTLVSALAYPALMRTAFAWLECITMVLLSFWFCEHNVICGNFRHMSVWVDTLMGYLLRTTTALKNQIKERLQDRFAIVFDSWS